MTEIEKKFVGIRKLLEFAMSAGGGPKFHPYGEDGSGYISYSDEARMSAQIMAQGRPPLEIELSKVIERKGRLTQGRVLEPIEVQELAGYFHAGGGGVSYGGTFAVEEGTGVHPLEDSLIPEWVSAELRRDSCFEGQRFLLSAEMAGLDQNLVWERV